jgi:hypothetical protein
VKYILGVDVGTRQDHSALVLIRRVERLQPKRALPGTWEELSERQMIYSSYEVPLMERLPLGIEYRELISRIRTIMDLPALFRQDVQIAMDATGVGYPVIQQMIGAGIGVIGVTITGGTSVAQNDIGYTVPKRDLVTALQVVAQNRRLQVSPKLALAPEFEKELQVFRRTTSQAKNEKYSAEEGEHDDIVLAAAIAVWYFERAYGIAVPAPIRGENAVPEYNALRLYGKQK